MDAWMNCAIIYLDNFLMVTKLFLWIFEFLPWNRYFEEYFVHTIKPMGFTNSPNSKVV